MSEQRSAAKHLTRLAGDLRELAERHRLGTLSYLLGLVVAEGVLQTKEREQSKRGTARRNQVNLHLAFQKRLLEKLDLNVKLMLLRKSNALDQSHLDMLQVGVEFCLNQGPRPSSSG